MARNTGSCSRLVTLAYLFEVDALAETVFGSGIMSIVIQVLRLRRAEVDML